MDERHAELVREHSERATRAGESENEVNALRGRLAALDAKAAQLEAEITSLRGQPAPELDTLRAELAAERARSAKDSAELKSLQTENEDLLVLLDDLSTRRKQDKARMRAEGWQVSDDDDEDEDA